MDDKTILEIAGVEVGEERPKPAVWSQLELSKGEKPKPSLPNLFLILTEDPQWRGQIRYNQFTATLELRGREITDVAESEAALWIAQHYDIHANTAKVAEAMMMVAHRNAYHPIQSYLEGLSWDGNERARALLTFYLGAENTPLNADLSECWLISCVARVMQPGCKVDTTLILQGHQGARKSSALRALAVHPGWFSDSALDLNHPKEAYQSLPGVWIYELSELDSIRGKANTAIKAFLSSPCDKYRKSYGRNDVRVHRQCVFVGTTNKDEFLSDETGSRRFWPVAVGEINLPRIEQDRDQLWAEAVHLYKQGKQWWLNTEASKELEAASQDFREQDPWQAPIAVWLSSSSRQFSTQDVLSSLGKLPREQTKGDQMRIGAILKELGCTKVRGCKDGIQARLWEKS